MVAGGRVGFRTPLNLLTFPCVDRSPLRPNQSYRAPAEMYPRRHERGAAMATNSRPTAWCQPSAAPGGVVDSAGRSAPPHGATAKGGGVGNSAAWSKDSCQTGRAAVGQLAVAASPFSRRAPLSKICSTAELKPAPRYSGRYRRCRRRVPCITASVQRTQLDPVVLYGTASQGTIRVGASENSMLRPFRRVGRVASWRSLSQQTWRFPRIDSRSIEASSAPTRRGAACARGCRLKAGTPLRSARILSTVAAGGI